MGTNSNELCGKLRRASPVNTNMSREEKCREKLKILLNGGINNISKLEELTGLSRSTIFRLKSKFKSNTSIKRKAGSGGGGHQTEYN